LKEASYSGGGNITFKGSLEKDTKFMRRIYEGEFILSESLIHFFYSVSHLSPVVEQTAPQSIFEFVRKNVLLIKNITVFTLKNQFINREIRLTQRNITCLL